MGALRLDYGEGAPRHSARDVRLVEVGYAINRLVAGPTGFEPASQLGPHPGRGPRALGTGSLADGVGAWSDAPGSEGLDPANGNPRIQDMPALAAAEIGCSTLARTSHTDLSTDAIRVASARGRRESLADPG